MNEISTKKLELKQEARRMIQSIKSKLYWDLKAIDAIVIQDKISKYEAEIEKLRVKLAKN